MFSAIRTIDENVEDHVNTFEMWCDRCKELIKYTHKVPDRNILRRVKRLLFKTITYPD